MHPESLVLEYSDNRIGVAYIQREQHLSLPRKRDITGDQVMQCALRITDHQPPKVVDLDRETRYLFISGSGRDHPTDGQTTMPDLLKNGQGAIAQEPLVPFVETLTE
jgi:hypothetical protein